MKKDKSEMRADYKRSAFVKLERGKFYSEVAAGTAVVFLEPAIAKAFPTSQAVNEALAGLLVLSEKTLRSSRPSSRSRAKAVRTG